MPRWRNLRAATEHRSPSRDSNLADPASLYAQSPQVLSSINPLPFELERHYLCSMDEDVSIGGMNRECIIRVANGFDEVDASAWSGLDGTTRQSVKYNPFISH